jgi:hypothetical protein
MGWRGGEEGGLAVVLEFSGLVDFFGEGLDGSEVSVEREAGKRRLEFSGVSEVSGEGLIFSGASAESETGEGDGLSESVWAGLIWMGWDVLLEPVRDLFGEAALLYGPCGDSCNSPTGGPRMDCVEGETGF